MKLKFLNYTSLIALFLSQSSPLLSMMEDDLDENPVASSIATKGNNQEPWVDALFVKKVFHFGSKLILDNLKREVIGVSFQAMKDPNHVRNNQKRDLLMALMDQELNANPEDENLHKFLFNLYSGGLLKNSVFINQAKANALLNNACDQKWGWAFWERAQRSPEHAQGKLSRDHYMSINYNVEAAIQYFDSKKSQNLYTQAEAKIFFIAVSKNAKYRPIVDAFVKKWTEIGFAQPFLDGVDFFKNLPMSGFSRISTENLKLLQDSFLRHAASLGHPRAISWLGEEIAKRIEPHLEKNLKSQEKSLREFVELRFPSGMYYLARLLVDENREEAIRLLLKGTHLGSHFCMERLGGVLRETHPEEALEWTRKAAALGNKDAILFLDRYAEDNLEDSEAHLRMRVAQGDRGSMNKLGVFLRDKNPKEAFELIKRAAELGEREAMNNYGLLLENTHPQEALSWFKKSAEAGSFQGMTSYGAKLQYTNEKEALKYLRLAAKGNNSIAMYNLYLMLRESHPQEARQWLLKSTEANDVRAMISYAGLIQKEDPEAAKNWLLKALKIDKNDVYANHILGDIYYRENNIPEAIKWYRQAAELNHAPAMFNLGVILESINYEEAVNWAHKAINLGYVDAMNLMGCLLEHKQHKDSEKYFLMAAERGSKDAMFNVGLAYKNKNPRKAKKWFLKAALLDSVEAMGSFGYMLLQEGNLNDALFWIEKAAGLGDVKSQNLLNLCRFFTGAFIEALQETQPIIQDEEKSEDINDVFNAFETQNLSSIAIAPSQEPKLLTEKEKSVETLSSEDEADETSSSDSSEPVEVPAIVESGDTEIEVIPHKEEIKNPKTRREMAKALAMHRKQIGGVEQEELRLSETSETIVSDILSQDSDHIQKENLQKLFSDPYFSNQVRVIDTKSGFTVIAHHRSKNEHRTTGAHRKHGKEKYTGRIHPETLKDVKEILKLFDVVKQ